MTVEVKATATVGDETFQISRRAVDTDSLGHEIAAVLLEQVAETMYTSLGARPPLSFSSGEDPLLSASSSLDKTTRAALERLASVVPGSEGCGFAGLLDRAFYLVANSKSMGKLLDHRDAQVDAVLAALHRAGVVLGERAAPDALAEGIATLATRAGADAEATVRAQLTLRISQVHAVLDALINGRARCQSLSGLLAPDLTADSSPEVLGTAMERLVGLARLGAETISQGAEAEADRDDLDAFFAHLDEQVVRFLGEDTNALIEGRDDEPYERVAVARRMVDWMAGELAEACKVREHGALKIKIAQALGREDELSELVIDDRIPEGFAFSPPDSVEKITSEVSPEPDDGRAAQDLLSYLRRQLHQQQPGLVDDTASDRDLVDVLLKDSAVLDGIRKRAAIASNLRPDNLSKASALEAAVRHHIDNSAMFQKLVDEILELCGKGGLETPIEAVRRALDASGEESKTLSALRNRLRSATPGVDEEELADRERFVEHVQAHISKSVIYDELTDLIFELCGRENRETPLQAAQRAVRAARTTGPREVKLNDRFLIEGTECEVYATNVTTHGEARINLLAVNGPRQDDGR